MTNRHINPPTTRSEHLNNKDSHQIAQATGSSEEVLQLSLNRAASQIGGTQSLLAAFADHAMAHGSLSERKRVANGLLRAMKESHMLLTEFTSLYVGLMDDGSPDQARLWSSISTLRMNLTGALANLELLDPERCE